MSEMGIEKVDNSNGAVISEPDAASAYVEGLSMAPEGADSGKMRIREIGPPMRLIYGDMVGVFFLCWIPMMVGFFFPWSLIIPNTRLFDELTLHQLAFASLIAIFPWIVLILHLWRGRLWDGILDMLLWALWECIIVLILCYLYPDQSKDLIFKAGSYWSEMKDWLVSGEGPEGSPIIWLPIHAKHLATLIIGAFVLGLPALIMGVLQLNYMNFYVANVVEHSNNPLLTLAVAWHFWSIFRVIGFIVIASAIFQLFMGWVIRRPMLKAWVVSALITGVVFIILDGVCKWLYAENVRISLNTLTSIH